MKRCQRIKWKNEYKKTVHVLQTNKSSSVNKGRYDVTLRSIMEGLRSIANTV